MILAVALEMSFMQFKKYIFSTQISPGDALKLEISSHKDRCNLLSQHLSMCLATTVSLP